MPSRKHPRDESAPAVKSTGCCPPFDPNGFPEKMTFRKKLFVKDSVFSIFYIPLNFGSVVTRCMDKIKAAGAREEPGLLLADHCSFFGTTVYIPVKKTVPDAQCEEITGQFLTKVFEGPYKNMRFWYSDMQKFVDDQGLKIKRLLVHYPTCPACAKEYGKNYVALLAQTEKK